LNATQASLNVVVSSIAISASDSALKPEKYHFLQKRVPLKKEKVKLQVLRWTCQL
jgi:hypothetical protein